MINNDKKTVYSVIKQRGFMNNNRMIKALLVALILNSTATPLQADWLAPMRNFFNNPTKEKLIVSSALAGISLLTAVYCYRGLGKLHEQQKKYTTELKDAYQKKNEAEASNRALLSNNAALQEENTSIKQDITAWETWKTSNWPTIEAAIRELDSLKAERGNCSCRHQQPNPATGAAHTVTSPRAADISGFGSIDQLPPSAGTGTLRRFNLDQVQQVEADAEQILSTFAADDDYADQNLTPSPAATRNNESGSAKALVSLQPIMEAVENLEKTMEKEGDESDLNPPSASPKE